MPTDPSFPAAEATPSRRVPWSIVLLAAGLIAVLAFAFLVSRITSGDAFAFDQRIILSLRVAGDPATPVGSARFASAVRDVTALGSSTVLAFVVGFAALLLVALGRWRIGVMVVLATALGTWANTVIKDVVSRARPDLVPHLMDESSPSFPSGHAANSAIVYLTLAVLVLPFVRPVAARGLIIGAAVILVAAIGASRVYLGVHWPSDVAGGWLYGTLWALGWWRIELAMLRGKWART